MGPETVYLRHRSFAVNKKYTYSKGFIKNLCLPSNDHICYIDFVCNQIFREVDMKKSLYIPACASLALVMGLSYADSALASNQEQSEASPKKSLKTKVKKVLHLESGGEKIDKVDHLIAYSKGDVKKQVAKAKKDGTETAKQLEKDGKTARQNVKNEVSTESESREKAKDFKRKLANASKLWIEMMTEHQQNVIVHYNKTDGPNSEKNTQRLANIRQTVNQVRTGLGEGTQQEKAKAPLGSLLQALSGMTSEEQTNLIREFDTSFESNRAWEVIRQKQSKKQVLKSLKAHQEEHQKRSSISKEQLERFEQLERGDE